MFVLGTILLVRIVGSFNNTVKLLGQALQVIAPFLVGAFIAFILYPLVRFFYRNLFKNTLHMKSDKLSKWLSILVTYVIAIGVIAILMVFILPQLYTSITDIVDRLPVWYNNLTTMVDNFENRLLGWKWFFLITGLISCAVFVLLPLFLFSSVDIYAPVLFYYCCYCCCCVVYCCYLVIYRLLVTAAILYIYMCYKDILIY
jgi:hypothetical protein